MYLAWQAQYKRHLTLERWDRQIAKFAGMRLSALHSSSHVLRKCSRITSFLMLPNSKFGGSLAELLRFGAVQFHFLRKSHRLPSFGICQLPLSKEALHNNSDKSIDS